MGNSNTSEQRPIRDQNQPQSDQNFNPQTFYNNFQYSAQNSSNQTSQQALELVPQNKCSPLQTINETNTAIGDPSQPQIDDASQVSLQFQKQKRHIIQVCLVLLIWTAAQFGYEYLLFNLINNEDSQFYTIAPYMIPISIIALYITGFCTTRTFAQEVLVSIIETTSSLILMIVLMIFSMLFWISLAELFQNEDEQSLETAYIVFILFLVYRGLQFFEILAILFYLSKEKSNISYKNLWPFIAFQWVLMLYYNPLNIVFFLLIQLQTYGMIRYFREIQEGKNEYQPILAGANTTQRNVLCFWTMC